MPPLQEGFWLQLKALGEELEAERRAAKGGGAAAAALAAAVAAAGGEKKRASLERNDSSASAVTSVGGGSNAPAAQAEQWQAQIQLHCVCQQPAVGFMIQVRTTFTAKCHTLAKSWQGANH